MHSIGLTVIISNNNLSPAERRQMNSCTTLQLDKEILIKLNTCVINDMNVNTLCHFFCLKCQNLNNRLIVSISCMRI